jgi:hypothetical protein
MGYTWEMFQKAIVQCELATETTTSSTLMGFHTKKAAEHFAFARRFFENDTKMLQVFITY